MRQCPWMPQFGVSEQAPYATQGGRMPPDRPGERESGTGVPPPARHERPFGVAWLGDHWQQRQRHRRQHVGAMLNALLVARRRRPPMGVTTVFDGIPSE